jgi:hypothetical protein
MRLTRRWKIVLAAAVGVAALVAGGAVAATKLMSPNDRSQAIVNDAAKQLGVEPAKLSAALKKAVENQVDAEVAAGRITKEQGEALKQRIESSDFPLLGVGGPGFGPGGRGFGFGHRGGFAHHMGLDAAANYLGMTEAELRTELVSGKSLAEVAKAKGKSVDGLVDALVADAKTKIDAAVKAGRLTQAQADEVLSDLKTRVTERVNGVHGAEHMRGFRDGGPDFGGPPAFGPPPGVPPTAGPPA